MRQNYSFSKNGNALLEPCEGKLSCTVLRGESPSNGADLLDRQSGSHPFVYLRNGIFLQKAEKREPQPKSGLPEQVGREGAEPHRKVGRRIVEHQYAAGQ